MEQARRTLGAAKRRWKGYISDENQRLREARNEYYRVIRKAKKQCWQSFLQDDAEVTSDRIQQEDTDRCWTALRFTNPRAQATTPAMKKPNETMTVTMKDKEALIRTSTFSKSPQSIPRAERIERGTAHRSITAEAIRRALFGQAIKKTPGSDKLTFKILRLLWEWDAERVERLIRHSIRLRYHLKRWKLAREVLLKKPAMICEAGLKLRKGQMGARKRRCAVDAVAAMLHKVQEIWSRKRFAEALFMNVKEVFDHVNNDKLICRIQEMKIDDDLINWTKSFLTNH